MHPDGPLLQLDDISKTYVTNGTRTHVLKHVSFDVFAGDALAIVGPSGAGKTTLLNIIGTIDRPSSGALNVRGDNILAWDNSRLAEYRNRKIGFIFQFHHLLPEFNALENVMMPALIGGTDSGQAQRRARGLLGRMGLEKRCSHKQGELSGGEQQRVAVARALIMEPELVLADEPTGNLDSHTGEEIFGLLMELNREMNMTLIIVTHNREFSSRLPRCVAMMDGALES